MSSSPSLANGEKKHWWLSNRKIVDKHIKDSKTLIATQEPSNVSASLALLDSALALSPRLEVALELKARALLFLRRFRDVADMLQEYIPSYKMSNDDDSFNSLGSSEGSTSSREKTKLLSSVKDEEGEGESSFRCFSVSDLKRKVMAGIWNNREKEGQWRYMILGQACYHLGLMEDAMVLLQTGRRLAAAAYRRESTSQSDDSFAFRSDNESDSASLLLSHIKLLLRRRAAAMAAHDAGIVSESIRHFSKILDSRRGIPHTFAAGCFVSRSAAFRSAGRVADSIADCNRALALDPTSIPALRARAGLFEYIQSVSDCLQDLDHLKLLYDVILRDRKLPGPAWKPHYNLRYRDIPTHLKSVTTKIQECRTFITSGQISSTDYYKLIGVRRGCTRSELDRAKVVLELRHKVEKSTAFIERLEFGARDVDTVRDQARASASMLYRMLQKGFGSVMAASAVVVSADDVAVATDDVAVATATAVRAVTAAVGPGSPAVYQGVFCRDIAAVGVILSRVGFNCAIPVKYEALSC